MLIKNEISKPEVPFSNRKCRLNLQFSAFEYVLYERFKLKIKFWEFWNRKYRSKTGSALKILDFGLCYMFLQTDSN